MFGIFENLYSGMRIIHGKIWLEAQCFDHFLKIELNIYQDL